MSISANGSSNGILWTLQTGGTRMPGILHAHDAIDPRGLLRAAFGGLQFAARTWLRVHGSPQPAFAHPDDPAYPFTVSPQEQLHRAWLVWLADGRSWRSWGAVGAACARARAASPAP